GSDEFAGLAMDGAPDGFEDGFGVVEADADAEAHEEREIEEGFPAGDFGEEFALGEDEEGAGGTGGKDEENGGEEPLCPDDLLEGAVDVEEAGVHQDGQQDHQ